MASSCSNVDVLVELDIKAVPSCCHGPCLLFEQYTKDGRNRKFFACSAFRNRKQCSFFRLAEDLKDGHRRGQLASDPLSQNEAQILKCEKRHTAYRKRYLQFKKLPRKERTACTTCGVVLLPGELNEHDKKGHVLRHRVRLHDLQHPTSFFTPHEDNKTYAQYLFSETTVDFLLSYLESKDFTHVLCVGAPRIHEAITLRKRSGNMTLTSLLMDLDERYMQVYPHRQMCLYNMFNHYFFDSKGEAILISFLRDGGKGVVLVSDPPFGGMVEPLVATFRKIEQSWQQDVETDSDLPIIWFFPYFMEKRITDAMPSLTMLDYKVDYENHTLFKTKEVKKKKGSPVRIFTNLPAELFALPASEGYWFCTKCQRFSAEENRHCDKCGSCTSKDGTTYKHCDSCKRCVKPSRVHCPQCNVCDLPSHMCGQQQHKLGCHICGMVEHKRKDCPQKFSLLHQKRKKRFGEEKDFRSKKRRTKT